jgi:hypothetical protein
MAAMIPLSRTKIGQYAAYLPAPEAAYRVGSVVDRVIADWAAYRERPPAPPPAGEPGGASPRARGPGYSVGGAVRTPTGTATSPVGSGADPGLQSTDCSRDTATS